MRKSYKKLIASVVACILAGTMAFNGTLAYLTDTEGAVNIATVGKVNIDLEEPGYPGNDSDEVKSIIPNQEITKDPQVENTGDNAALVYLKVDVPQETFTELGTDGVKGETKQQDLFALKGLSENWELIKTETSTDTDTQKTKTTYVYAYRKTLDKGAKTDKLFERVQMKNAVESDLSGRVEDIVIQACAIQATDIPDVDLAADENGYLKTGSLSDIYGIFMAQSGDKDVRPADEGNRAQNGKLGKITYVLDGGTLPADALTEYGSDDFGYAPPTPTKQYYSFAGWEPENISDESTGNVSFTARWTPDVLGSIQYNLDGGTMSGEKTEYTADDFGYVPPTPTKKDYKFIGWEPEQIPTDSTGDVTFAAKWDINTAELLNGEKICLIMKKLAGDNPVNYYDSNSNIEAIQKSNVAPEISVTENPNSIISTNNSGQPVYAWFENGVIKWWSKAEQISADTNMAYLCCGMKALTDISGLSEWDVKKVTNMSYMFWENNSLRDLTPIANWKVENAINMAGLFQFCGNLLNLTPLANWQVNNVTDMSAMFRGCSQLTNLTSLANWQTGKVTSMSSMFWGCSQLTDLTPLANWQTGKVTDMISMFSGCSQLSNLTGLTNWQTGKVTNMYCMFEGCRRLTDLTPLANWQTGNVTYMTSMFEGCSQLTNLAPLTTWQTGKVTGMTNMFKGCSQLTNLTGLENWQTSNVTIMSTMFSGCSQLTNLSGLTNWQTGKVTNMSSMFFRCSQLTDLTGLANWQTGNVTTMSRMFYGCSQLTNLTGLANWQTGNVTYMTSMFSGCSQLANAFAINDWNIAKVGKNNFKNMFGGCPSHPTFTKRAGTWDYDGTFTPTK